MPAGMDDEIVEVSPEALPDDRAHIDDLGPRPRRDTKFHRPLTRYHVSSPHDIKS
jgi:hypothetical protein